jgi:C_GCAxxG_C_C family probable redox protein
MEELMKASSIMEVRKNAEDYFASGLYCAESVVLAIATAQGVESDVLPKVATAFCSGMARSCSTCGALTGAIMGIGLALGRSTPDESVEPSFAATQKLIKEFEKEFGDCNCSVLLGGCDLNTSEGQTMFVEKNLMEHCLQITGKAAEIAARIIVESKG